MSQHVNLDVIRRLSEGDWREVCKELENRIKQNEQALRICKPEDLAKHQARIACMEELKLLPEQILDREE